MPVGTVALVGAGPGDPGLMTVRGLALLRGAEVVVYDRLVDRRLLREAPRARRIFAGKASGDHALPQEQINAVLIAHARRGRRVVRLKGGDPFVFGRGGEEAEALAAAGVPFEVVPGVSSAVAAPAYAGVPLTHRGIASSFAVVTGHECAKDADRVDWRRLATAVDTLVILMGIAALPRIARELLAHGRAPQTPVALVRWGTTERQVVLTGRLDDIASRAQAARLASPVVIVVGDVVALRARLAWFKPGNEVAHAGRTLRRRLSASGAGDRPSPSLWPAGPVRLHPDRSAASAVRIVGALKRPGPRTSPGRSARTGGARTRARWGACDRTLAPSRSAPA